METIQLLGSSEPYQKIKPVADLLGFKEFTVAGWAKHYPDFPCLRLPGGLRVRITEVEKWLVQFQDQPIRRGGSGKVKPFSGVETLTPGKPATLSEERE